MSRILTTFGNSRQNASKAIVAYFTEQYFVLHRAHKTTIQTRKTLLSKTKYTSIIYGKQSQNHVSPIKSQ